MFRKISSLNLLVKAEKAEASAAKSLAAAQKARASAARQRLLATRMVAEEKAVRLDRTALVAESLTDQATIDYQIAVTARNTAEATLEMTKRGVGVTKNALETYRQKSKAARDAAKVARAEVPVIESEKS